MAQKKKRIEAAPGPAMPPTASSPTESSSAGATEARSGSAATASSPAEWGCEAVVKRVIRLAHAARNGHGRADGGDKVAGDKVAGDKAVPAAADASPSAPQKLFSQALSELEPDMALKLRTLMVAGRDGQSISAVQISAAPETGSSFAGVAPDSNGDAPLLGDYLQRGHALACATALDLERPVAGWASTAPQSLDERAWLSFGKQLATSEPDDWRCLAFMEPGHREVSKLYVKLGDNAWWSFQSLLDRPSAAAVDKQKRALTSRRSKGVTTTSLKALVQGLAVADGRALRRAAKAIRARVGQASE